MISANTKKRIFTSLILFSVILIIFKFNQVLLYFLLIFSILSILEFFNLTKKIFNKKLNFILSNFLFITYLSIFSSTFFYLSNFLDSKIILFSILLTCIASDLGGFIFGKFFKGPKLTKISPNKTFSGAIGSLIFSCIIFCLIIIFFFENRIKVNSCSNYHFARLSNWRFIFFLFKKKSKIKRYRKFSTWPWRHS